MLCYGILFLLIPESRESLSRYFFDRALLRISEGGETSGGFYIAGRLLMQIAIPFIIVLILLFAKRKSASENNAFHLFAKP